MLACFHPLTWRDRLPVQIWSLRGGSFPKPLLLKKPLTPSTPGETSKIPSLTRKCAHIFLFHGFCTNSVSFRAQAKYTEWVTANCRRNLVPTFADIGASRGQRDESPTVVNLYVLNRSRYPFQLAPHLSSRGWMDPVPDPLLRRKFCSAGNRTKDLWVSNQELWPLDHRVYSTLNLWYWKVNLSP
jgi:hypothetical protein